MIFDNYIIAHEILHPSKKKKKSKIVVLKLDMAKACDRLEWDFLSNVLEAFGFHKIFVRLINECVSSVSISILLNCSPYGNFTPSRGL